ncbi:hypothetical protein [Nostoc parmelioides]|uniref:Uncharacterized protein n=1 Tax=Nostoc parmelioides FACHB-3921 TaxID=2692909 RepID=A0ABR8BAY3_9NOSO|nr:hypothetical protein [Nostoc parmelioides]MBD2251248.1 hypothetical protein [Nostoc parmelioides FACHB-3921]
MSWLIARFLYHAISIERSHLPTFPNCDRLFFQMSDRTLNSQSDTSGKLR